MKGSLVGCATLAYVLAVPLHVGAQSLTTARELYVSTAYGDALAMLTGLLENETALEERQSIELYRALCLVGLGRKAEADRVVEAMIATDPLYRPSTDDIPPRIRSTFSDARRRMLPAMAQQIYKEAKASFDHQEFGAAAGSFKLVLDVLADPDVAPVAHQSPLSDLGMLAAGFHALSAKASAPPPPPPPPVVVTVPAAPVPDATRIYNIDDPNVVPPIAIRQSAPPFQGLLRTPGVAMVEVVIDAAGTVELASIVVALNPQYDKRLLSAAKGWRYQPATLDGVAVRVKKRIQVNLLPNQDANP